jgi:hypothetical protein
MSPPPPMTSYLFIGSVIGSSASSLDNLVLLMAMKFTHPQNIFIIRGSNDFEAPGRLLGFYDLCKSSYFFLLTIGCSFCEPANLKQINPIN